MIYKNDYVNLFLPITFQPNKYFIPTDPKKTKRW